MFNPTDVLIRTCVSQLQAGYHKIYGHLKPNYEHLIGWVTNMALTNIAKSNAPYHNVEHTILVTLVGQEILRGKQIREGCVSPEDWLHCIISWLCHDIGYVKGVCYQDQAQERFYATGIDDAMVILPPESTDASLTPYHVDRGKLFVEQYFSGHEVINLETIKHHIESTRFPVPVDQEHQDTVNYPGLIRAADLIGQLADPQYLQKMTSLFYEFEETGANEKLGYRHPGDLRHGYPKFFWTVVYPYIQDGLRHLEVTRSGQQIITNLYANVFVVEEELLRSGAKQLVENSRMGFKAIVTNKSKIVPFLSRENSDDLATSQLSLVG